MSYQHGLSDYSPLPANKGNKITHLHTHTPQLFWAPDCETILKIQVQIIPMPVNKLPLIPRGLTGTCVTSMLQDTLQQSEISDRHREPAAHLLWMNCGVLIPDLTTSSH